MKAIRITRPGSPDVMSWSDAPDPVPGPREIRVRVRATGVNRADLMQRAGHYPPPPGWPTDIPGLEYAGTVESLGEGATRWRVGDRVMGLVGGGSYAELVRTHEDEAIAIPDAMSFAEAAAIPEVFITAHDALFTRMRLNEGETVLIHAVGSGVGTAALQLAKARGATVIGTQRSAWKLDRARGYGLDEGIEGSDFAARVLEITGGRGVDGIVDLVGGDYLQGNLKCIATLGRIIVVGLVASARAELDMRALLNRRATIIGTVLRARTLEEKVAAARAFERDALHLLENGRVRPVVDEVMSIDEAPRAHRLLEGAEVFGKLVLEVPETSFYH